ncbi:MAG TPA: VWA domain-containing protein [Bryobacteraceae bacterium]|nr:VWA domain-containing protein [Bryobacteraceae bacterium]
MSGERLLIAAATVICALAAQSGQDQVRTAVAPRARPETRSSAPGRIRLDVRQVVIPVTVTGAFGEPLRGLPQEAFRVFEDGVEQAVSYFASEDAPVSVGVVFDASASMEHKLGRSREAVARLFHTSMPGDEYFLVEFNNAPRVLCEFTSSMEEIQDRLSFIQPQGWTSLFDAVYLAVHKMKRARNPRKALLILSDGADNNSRYTEPEIREIVREGDVCIYSIGMAGWGITGRSMRALRHLAEETGGRLFPVENLNELPGAVEKMSAALRNQYVLGYSSTNADNDGKYRKVEVRLVPPDGSHSLRATWRLGYYAPAGLSR